MLTNLEFAMHTQREQLELEGGTCTDTAPECQDEQAEDAQHQKRVSAVSRNINGDNKNEIFSRHTAPAGANTKNSVY
jgi:hypothetical protein